MQASELEIQVRVHAVDDQARGVRVFDLRHVDGAPLPDFEAGSHIDLAVGEAGVRQYSLFNAPGQTDRYCIAVALDAQSRGGSHFLHERVRPGDVLAASAPRNHFALAPDPAPSVLIAGGIGITPLWAMAQALEAQGRPWELHYGARDREDAALLAQIEPFAARARHGRVRLYFSRAAGGGRMALGSVIRQAPTQAHLYCCGGKAMLEEYKALTRSRPASHVHLEHFQPTQAAATAGGYAVMLARSGRQVDVGAGQTILDALEGAGIRVAYTCREGICGDCEVRVLEGVPEHRDDVLTEAERATNASMMICCSGCRGTRLVLDL
ncbi:PDR/VanB family oxidoreductase [Pseudoxanthomonas winnipegensis]|uniref:Oxidoreductase n=1 Tax=Pseudoxanthomonas winnipegensis TaxID=2480810 RepID=A0A4Q8LLI1_9GAMM|nr:PDR/VanB family oxidoreductase [Pseudoxanthomonas winnipegensis]RZZ86267.1 oxidoreductase [Pseudoxanthomonas winnipegensis]TAA31404.1 oxidoreductase [Pseudoxanthomonas winnipegensis]TBV77200.1 oxidoreductase [Pseudoxanthomonas winnipegensis]